VISTVIIGRSSPPPFFPFFPSPPPLSDSFQSPRKTERETASGAFQLGHLKYTSWSSSPPLSPPPLIRFLVSGARSLKTRSEPPVLILCNIAITALRIFGLPSLFLHAPLYAGKRSDSQRKPFQYFVADRVDVDQPLFPPPLPPFLRVV